jgi:GTP cyclohydrolase I
LQTILTDTEVRKLSVTLSERIDAALAIGKSYDSLYAVPMGGYPVAAMLSELLTLPLTTVVRKNTLIVDDLIDSGRTLSDYKNDKAVLLVKNNRMTEVNYFAEQADGWVVFPWEKCNGAHDIVTRMMQYIGEDVTREGLIETPQRVVNSWKHLFSGYSFKPETLIKSFSKETYDEMILLRDCEFYSTCEHHLLPFFGTASIAYIPDKKIIGISKLARILEAFARRLQIQERIGENIADFIEESIQPKGVAVLLEAQHFCMTARGVEKQKSKMVTSTLRGAFKEAMPRAEFFNIARSEK